ncbi:HD domain-containing protein [Candidatus Woesearchaeota archaeon]|nr:HD domain-containing protein [Candidatus Woesearchaeota archaeon]
MFTPRKKGNEINDGILRNFNYPPYLLDLLDSAELQRAHYVRQNGFTSISYPNLTHTRKVHLIGTARNAILMWGNARANTNFYDKDINYESVISSAALLHDIGHAPFSHGLEVLISAFSGKTHEQVAAEIVTGEFSLLEFYKTIPEGIISAGQKRIMIDLLSGIPSIPEILRQYCIPPETVAQIIHKKRFELLQKEGKGNDCISKNAFLREFIDGDVIDADKLEYLIRDPRNAGITETRFDPESLIASLGIVEYDDKYHLGISEQGLDLVNQLLTTRAFMYTTVYTHKTVLKIEAMIYESYKRFLKSLGREKMQEYGECLHLLDDTQFEAFMGTNSKDDIAMKLLLLAKYDRRNKYNIAYGIKGYEITFREEENNIKRKILEKLFAANGDTAKDLISKSISGELIFLDDFIRKRILEMVNTKNKEKIEDYEIIVYFPHPRKMVPNMQQLYEKFNLYVFEKNDPKKVYHSSNAIKDHTFFDERLEKVFQSFCRAQTSYNFIVLTPEKHVQRVKKATEEYIKELLK